MGTEPQEYRLTKHPGYLVIAGCVLSTVVIFTLHGSRWPTVLFLLVGLFLPVPLGHLLSRISRRRIRWPGLLSLIVTTLGILIVAWIGKYPNPAWAFQDSLKIAPPANIQNLSAYCGWYDGRITIIRFTSDVATIRKLLPSGTEPQLFLEYPGHLDQIKDIDAHWQAAIQPGWIVDRSVATFPGWRTPWYAHWDLPSKSTEPSGVQIVWDDQTGQAIVVSTKE